MQVEKQSIADVKVLIPKKHGDHRGFFSETYSRRSYGCTTPVIEVPKFTNEVQHRYKPELRWARDMTSSILMIVLRFPGCMQPGNLVVRSAT